MRHTKFVHSFLEDSADSFPDKPALLDGRRRCGFAELNGAANRLARLLLKLGLKKGERVALYIENSMEYVVTYYAVLKAGGVAVALNTENTADDTSYIVANCGARFLVTDEKMCRKRSLPAEDGEFGKVFVRPPSLESILLWSDAQRRKPGSRCEATVLLPRDMEQESLANPGLRLVDLDIAAIVYTSGSTGKPRGVVLSHLNIVSNTRSIVDYLELTSEDRIMVVLPFYYIYGKSLLHTHFYVGGSVVIDNRFLYPDVILETMLREEVTGFAGVPSTFSILLRRSNLRRCKFDKLRYVTQAGGSMGPCLQKQVAEAFAPARLYVMYGTTEASPRLSYLDPEDLPRKWGSIGKAIPNVELYIADPEGRALPAGVEGEIVARGSNIMCGYWNDPEATAQALRHGVYHTGDLGRMDDEGFIYVIGRMNDLIKIGGNRVSAKEIEEAICEHPAVVEAAVIGEPDDLLGEAPKAFVVVNGSDGARIIEELPAFLRQRLAGYKIPKSYEVRDTIPKSESGKVQKLRLKADSARMRDRRNESASAVRRSL